MTIIEWGFVMCGEWDNGYW